MTSHTNTKLPDTVATKSQLLRLIHEVEKIQDEALQGHVRKEQTGKEFVVSQPSSSLESILEAMGRQLTMESLKEARAWLQSIRENAPTVRVVFSSEPERAITTKVVRWFRDSTGLPVLLRVGVQPSIAGGCVVYTPNHRYDFTLRHQLLSGGTRVTDVMERIK